MKKISLFCILCLFLFAACATSEPEQHPKSEELPQMNIGVLLDDMRCLVYPCADGSEVVELQFKEQTAYLRYIPKLLPNGKYEFFQKFYSSSEVTYTPNGSVEIPICINDSGDFRYLLKVDFSITKEGARIQEEAFDFLYDEEKRFDEMYSSLDFRAKNVYRDSLKFDESLTGGAKESYLRACIYNGNMGVLKDFYRLTSSAGNPYEPEIFTGESQKDFPQPKTIELAAQSMQTGKSIQELGAEVIEPNSDWETVLKIPNLHDADGYFGEELNNKGVYRFDLDGDQLTEVLILWPGGSMGNTPWTIYHLDKFGNMTKKNVGEDLGEINLYRYKEQYFFTAGMIDFDDKEFVGWAVYALDENSKLYRADIWFDKSGSEIIMSDKYIEMNDDWRIEWELDGYIGQYKAFDCNAIGHEIEPGQEIKELFGPELMPYGKYGVFDINNDQIDDWAYHGMFFTSNSLPSSGIYEFVDGKTSKVIDFSKVFHMHPETLRYIVPYTSIEKNYLICVLGEQGNYVMKMVEVKGTEPIVIQEWLVSVRNRILIQASEIRADTAQE